MEKIDSFCDVHELFRIAKQRVGEKKEVVGVSCLNPIWDGLFWGWSVWGRVKKGPPSLKSVTQILK